MLQQQFHPHQKSYFVTHIHGGIVEIVFGSDRCDPGAWNLSPFSDHFVVFGQI